MMYEYSIATLAEGIVGLKTLQSLGIPFPADNPIPYSIEVPLGNGSVAGQGWAIVEWHWDVLRVSQWNILRTYCTGKSAEVYIRTYDIDENQTWKNYKAVMVFPTERPFTAGRVLDFTIIFQALELQGS